MPLLQSRKYPDKDEQFVDSRAWEIMKQKGLDRRFKVIDDNDIQETIIPSPQSMVDFTKVPVVEKDVEKILTRQEIKDKLDELGIVYNVRASTVKLLEKLNN